jgi:hypothetical protein
VPESDPPNALHAAALSGAAVVVVVVLELVEVLVVVGPLGCEEQSARAMPAPRTPALSAENAPARRRNWRREESSLVTSRR